MSRLFVAIALVLPLASAQMSMSAEEEEMMESMGIKGQPMGRKNLNPQAATFKKDLKYIACGMCRDMVDLAYSKSAELLEKRFKFQKKRKHDSTEFDGENAVQEYVEKMCNPLKPEGDWITKIDLKLEKGNVVLAKQPTHGKCNRECRTLEESCNAILDKADTDFTEILYNSVKEQEELEKVQRYICNRAAGVCKKKAPKLEARPWDETFHPMTAEEKQMQDMQANLKDSGMSGTMYKREDLAGMMDKMNDMMPGMMDAAAGEGGEGEAEEGGLSSEDEDAAAAKLDEEEATAQGKEDL